ncbi:MAG: ABC transporter ATP-binding protein [Erythrobacter sp.]|nr:ABC transporter ATP-binding protein [Erythrobacter sp.]
MTLAAHDATLSGRLAGVSAALEAGQLTAICGPNGAGKSSLLAALAGLLPLDAGRVTLGNAPLDSFAARKRAQAIGYLPQDGEVAWDIAVRSLVALGRLPHGDRGEEEVASALAALDLGALAGRPVSTLSGGERSRALLARVLAGQPQWILADEPLAALDLAHQQRLLREFRAQADAGAGVVMVVHDLALAANHADSVLVLDEGQVVESGLPKDALSSAVLREIWKVEAQWVGPQGARALQIG